MFYNDRLPLLFKNLNDYPKNDQKEIVMIRMCSRKEDIPEALKFGEIKEIFWA